MTNIPRQRLQDPEENGEAHLLLFISCGIENKPGTIHLERGHERGLRKLSAAELHCDCVLNTKAL